LGRPDDRAARAFSFRQDGVDALVGADDVRERDAAKAAAVRGDAGVGGERVLPVESQRRGTVAEAKLTHSPYSCWIGQPRPLL
jgi:hypothetical protein